MERKRITAEFWTLFLELAVGLTKGNERCKAQNWMDVMLDAVFSAQGLGRRVGKLETAGAPALEGPATKCVARDLRKWKRGGRARVLVGVLSFTRKAFWMFHGGKCFQSHLILLFLEPKMFQLRWRTIFHSLQQEDRASDSRKNNRLKERGFTVERSWHWGTKVIFGTDRKMFWQYCSISQM